MSRTAVPKMCNKMLSFLWSTNHLRISCIDYLRFILSVGLSKVSFSWSEYPAYSFFFELSKAFSAERCPLIFFVPQRFGYQIWPYLVLMTPINCSASLYFKNSRENNPTWSGIGSRTVSQKEVDWLVLPMWQSLKRICLKCPFINIHELNTTSQPPPISCCLLCPKLF